MLDGPQQTVRIAQRPDFLDLFRGQKFHVHANGFGHARIVFVFIHAILRDRQPDIRTAREPYVLAGFGFEFTV